MSSKVKATVLTVVGSLACVGIGVVANYYHQRLWGIVLILLVAILAVSYAIYQYRQADKADSVAHNITGSYDIDIDPAALKAWRRQHPNLSFEAAVEVYLHEQGLRQ